MVYCIRCLIIFIELLSSHFVLCGAGFTKAIQEVHLDSNIQLLDCPGIVFDDSESDAHHVLLKNCVNVDNLEDPAPAVAALLQRYDHGGCVKERERGCGGGIGHPLDETEKLQYKYTEYLL